MTDINEVLAEFFQKRPEPDADGFFHYLLQEKDTMLVVNITPYGQWTPELLKNTLIIDCHQNEIGLVWISDGIYRAALGGPFPVETVLYQDDEDEDAPRQELVFVGSNIVARIDLPPDPLHFWIGPRDYFYQMVYEEQTYRVLSPPTPLRTQ